MSKNDEDESTDRHGSRRREALAAVGSLGLGGLIASARLGGVGFEDQADTIFAAAGKSKAVLKLRERRKVRKRYKGTITLGVATT